MIAAELHNLSICYNGSTVIENLTHTFTAGQWHIILGRSGAGKTTLLHAIAGLLPDTAAITGSISPVQQHIALMQQQNDILPWLNILDNVSLAGRLHRKKTDRSRAMELLEACGIAEHAASRPQTLSGGQRQRAALARTLMQQQPIVLMDEPFSALDAITRRQLQDLSARLLRGGNITNTGIQQPKTVIMITHDPAEALRLADTLHILTKNKLTPVPLPADTPPRPADAQGMAQAEEQLIKLLSGTTNT